MADEVARDGDHSNPGRQISRLEALGGSTIGSAWFAKDEDEHGSFDVGKPADLVVAQARYVKVSDADLRKVESRLPPRGGRVVHASGPFAGGA